MMSKGSMSCERARACVTAGEVPAGVEEHLLSCESCAALALQPPRERLGITAAELDAMLDVVEARIEAERGVGAWLRARPTWLRRLLATLGCALLAAASAYGSSWLPFSASRLAASGAYSLLLVVVLRESLRPSHLPARVRSQLALAIGVVAVPALFALLSAAASDSAAQPARAGCLRLGLLMGLVLLGLLRALDRNLHAAGGSALLAVAAAGLLGNLALTLYCPGTDAAHLLRWHVPVGPLLLVFYFGLERISRFRLVRGAAARGVGHPPHV